MSNSLEEQSKLIDRISEELLQLVRKYFPNFPINSWGSSGPNFHIDLPTHFRSFKTTPYYYSKELRFIHWTSIKSLVSIINTGEIRLYNLFNSEDEEEFNYAADILRLSEDQIYRIKANYFTFSFCKRENLNDKFLWGKYGSDHSGVAIEFSILNDINDWINYMISEVYYSLPSEFESFQNELENFKIKYNGQVTLDFDVWRLAGFHKKTHFNPEKEIRLSTCFPFTYLEDVLKHTRKEFKIDGTRNRIVSYVPLKLWIDFDSHYPKSFHSEEFQAKHISYLSNKPQIKIENIYFGAKCKIENEEYYSVFRNALMEMISFNLGYNVDMPLELLDIDKEN